MGNGALTPINLSAGGNHPDAKLSRVPRRIWRSTTSQRCTNAPNLRVRTFGHEAFGEVLSLTAASPNTVSISRRDIDLPRRTTPHTELLVNGARGPFANKINGVYEYDNTQYLSCGKISTLCHGRRVYYKRNNQMSPSKRDQKSVIIRYTRSGHWIAVETAHGREQLVLARSAKSMLPDPEKATDWFVRKCLLKSNTCPRKTRSVKQFLESLT